MVFIALNMADAQQPSTGLVPVQTLTLKGVVRDPSGQPLSLAEVSTADGARAWTKDDGEFTLANVQGGKVILMVRRVGYVPLSREMETLPDVTVVTLAVSLVPNAQKLGTIVIEGKSLDQALLKLGFYERKKGGSGYFFDGEEVSRSAAPLTTMLTAVPSMRLDTPPGGGGLRVPVARSPDGLTNCPVNVYVDGQYIAWAHDVGVDNLVRKDDIRAMELYPRELSIPSAIASKLGKTIMNGMELRGGAVGGGTAVCGSLFIWTKYFDG